MKNVIINDNPFKKNLLKLLSGHSLIVFSIALCSASAFAAGGSDGSGPGSGGGGKGVVCREKDGTVKSVELLDLCESRVIYDRKIVQSDDSVDTQVAQGLQRLKNVMSYPSSRGDINGNILTGGDALVASMQDTAKTITNVNLGNVKRLRGVKLTLTPDSFEEATPDDCEVEQLVQYKNVGVGGGSDRVLMNQDLVDKLDTANLVALALHEALYSELRKFGEKSSVRVRRAVGYVMAGNEFKSLDSIVKGKRIDFIRSKRFQPHPFRSEGPEFSRYHS